MCGIAGIVNVNSTSGKHLSSVHQMANRMRRRGLDDERYLVITQDNTPHIFSGDDTPTCNDDISFFPSRHVKQGYDLVGDVFLGHRRYEGEYGWLETN